MLINYDKQRNKNVGAKQIEDNDKIGSKGHLKGIAKPISELNLFSFFQS